jgi:hypothetical protein
MQGLNCTVLQIRAMGDPQNSFGDESARCELASVANELDSLPEGELVDRYPYALVAYAELHTTLGQLDESRDYLVRALEHQTSRMQRMLLQRKLLGSIEGAHNELGTRLSRPSWPCRVGGAGTHGHS